MSAFQPNGIIKIGQVPWDNSYTNVMVGKDCFMDRTAQANFISTNFIRFSKSNYVYMRPNNSIKVEGNAEQYYNCNYVMFQNANFSGKWFYSFITDCNYINDNTTELVLELDVFQTWYFDWRFTPVFVERMHASNDTVGANLIPEPEYAFNTIATDVQYPTDFNMNFNDCWVVVQTNQEPDTMLGGIEITGLEVGSSAVSGGWYEHTYSGGKYLAFKKDDTTDEIDGKKIYNLDDFLKVMNKVGAAESISAIFMWPKSLSPSRGNDRGLEQDTSYHNFQIYLHGRPTTLDGYTPRNNKLFTYPYCFCRCSDMNGHYKEWKYELWHTGTDGAYPINFRSAIDPDATISLIPIGYDTTSTSNTNEDEAFRFPFSVHCSWNYSAYQNWLAQNSVANALSIASNAAMIAVPAAKGLKAMSGLRQTSRNIKAAKGAHTSASQASRLRSERRGAWDAFDVANNKVGQASMALGAWGLANTFADVNRQSHVPDSLVGSNSGNSQFATGQSGFRISQMCIQAQFAERLDKYFDMYGYQQDTMLEPLMHTRNKWNYVKTSGCCFHGNVPADDMALINQIHDAGVTYWHGNYVGEYDENNGIVS